MMDPSMRKAFNRGYERLASLSDLLDEINVFPVPDADTGRNLKISLSPLRQMKEKKEDIIHGLLGSATGNSGNIAACFFSGFIGSLSQGDLARSSKKGRDDAWQSIADPKQGTMLNVFDRLAQSLENYENQYKIPEILNNLTDDLADAVLSTSDMLPDLERAEVVDSGALGMFIFFEGFFKSLAGRDAEFLSINRIFSGKLKISRSFQSSSHNKYCVDTLVDLGPNQGCKVEQLSKLGDSLVIVPKESYLKVHLHTDDRRAVKTELESIGQIVKWSDVSMDSEINGKPRLPDKRVIHVMTDAAGSVTRKDAEKLGMTLLDSYIVLNDGSLPETFCPPSGIYESMKNGIRISTAQASRFERRQSYNNALDRYDKVLYLCVGSVYTGNYETAMEWKKENDSDDRFTIIDSTAASGRLGILALSVARYASQAESAEDVIGFAEESIKKSMEFIFMDKLKYLVAGGRLSKTSGFFGDLFNIKPIICPTALGAKKIGAVKNQKQQIDFALDQLEHFIKNTASPFIMMEYSDNLEFVKTRVAPLVRAQHPGAEIILQPMSLTSGVHMGPGTWGLAFINGE